MSRRPARTPIAVATLVAAAATLALAGCSSSSTGAAPSPPAGAASAASTGGAATAGSGSTGAAPGAATTPGGAGSGGSGSGGSGAGTSAAPTTAGYPGTPAGPGACTSAGLTVAQQDPSVGAGQYYSTLVFTNTSGHSCTLAGYPGVSYVAAAGQQSGNPATRTGTQYGTVTLAPHGTAKATLHDANGIGGYDPGQCQLTAAQGLRIYPPGEKAALFLPWQTQHCAGPTIHSLTIGPVTS